MYKVINSNSPKLVTLSIGSNQISHSYNTRKKDDIRKPFFRLTISPNAFSFQGPKFWNSLLPEIKSLKCKCWMFD